MAPGVEGTIDPAFSAVGDAFAENLASRGEAGAAFCVYLGGRPVVDIWGGPGYRSDTLQLVFSTTKGMVAVCAAVLVQRGVLDPEAPVARWWPEFSDGGKAGVTLGQLMSHQAGLAGCTDPMTLEDFLRWDPVVTALAAQEPLWPPGTAHGYHAFTFGHLVGEVVRRVTGRTVGRFFAEEVAGPLGLDAWIGLPAVEDARVAPLLAAPADPADPLIAALSDPERFTRLAFANPAVDVGAFNRPETHRAELPAGNGICTARALARMYAACIGEVDGRRLLAPGTVELVCRTRAEGYDLVLPYDTRFGLGFQLPFPARPMAGPGSFGHYGTGGSVGMALPGAGLAVGYTMSQIQSHPGPDPRTVALIDAVMGCLG